MKELRSEGFHFLDQEVIPNFDGDPNGLVAWFICEDHDAKERFDLRGASEALKKKMRDAGFPPGAVETIRTGVTSQAEIQAGGGRFYFFR
ncbi:MAG TPA: hypothetical protein VFO46_07885 [Candidatus Sulfotelmatobacter sp.]|nr:hypothetical protein [Candidatus Sulfotelmatobacter sp.]